MSGLIWGAMAGALGDSILTEVEADRKSVREQEALKQQKTMLLDLKKEELAYSAQLLQEQRAQIRELVGQMPKEVQADPFKASMYLAVAGHGELAKAIADVGQAQASAAASQASANKNNTEAALAPKEMELEWAKTRAEIAKINADTGKTRAETANVGRSSRGADSVSFDEYAKLPPDQRALFDQFKSAGKSQSADYMPPAAKNMAAFDRMSPEQQARLWDATVREEADKNLRSGSRAFMKPEDALKAAQESVTAQLGPRPGVAGRPAATPGPLDIDSLFPAKR